MKDDGIGKLNFSNTPYKRNQLFSLIGVIIVIGFLLGYLESLTRMYWSRAFGRIPFNGVDWRSYSRTWTCHYVCTISS